MNEVDRIRNLVALEFPECEVYFSSSDVPASILVPLEWLGFGLEPRNEVWLPDRWIDFSSRMPTVFKWLKACVVGTALVVSDKLYLAYIYRENNEIGIYLGGEPIGESNEAKKLLSLPGSLQDFYKHLHDGFYFYIDRSMGPSKHQDFVNISDLADEDLSGFPDLVGIFSNGAGDYVSVVSGFEFSGAYIWWHENQSLPDVNIDLWAVVDTWMGIFLENSDSNEDIIRSGKFV